MNDLIEAIQILEEVLVADDDHSRYGAALEWAAHATGAAGAVSFDQSGRLRGAVGVDPAELGELRRLLPPSAAQVEGHELSGDGKRLITVPIAGLEGLETLMLVTGQFSPAPGGDELSRVQRFMSAVTVGLDRKQLAEELRSANARLKAASEHKSVFLANMSHELRTPLNAIIGFSDLLLDGGDSQFDEPTRKRFLNQVHTSGKQLLALINDILDLSKVEAGQMELRVQTIEIEPLLAQVLESIEPLAVQKEISLAADAADAGAVEADAGKLRQMLLNLVSNAIKFTPPHGRVTVSARRRLDAVEIAVADTGIGISAEDQAKVFREFHQVDTGPGRLEQGTGLGLALTRRLAVLHGGDVHVESEPGRGSVFTLRVPTRQPAARAEVLATAEREAETRPARPLVMVIEDDSGAAELLTHQLEVGGFSTQVAHSGGPAVEAARRLRPAAITLDILLPDADGWDVLSLLKADPQTGDIPVVVVSVIDHHEQLGMALGALDYLVKPVDGRLLVDRLKRLKLDPHSGQQEPSVLVVDDEAATRQRLSRILEPAGFEVSVAAGGQEAIEQAREKRPDVVLLDLMMPEVTGLEVVEALRGDRRTEDTPIMILTAPHLTEEDKRRLNGYVSAILSRGSVGASNVVGLLQRVIGETVSTVAS